MGYDVYKGPFIGQITNYTNWTKYTNGLASTVTTYATTENVNDATIWVNAQSGKQFFLWLAFNAPHSPYHLLPSNVHTYNTLSGTASDINNNTRSYFKAMIQAMDTEMGGIFDSLLNMNNKNYININSKFYQWLLCIFP
jgi:arylsulfatase A-like enzyme